MPKPIVHLWTTKLLSERIPAFNTPAFFLGTILPDAVYTRKTGLAEAKKLSHLHSDDWAADVLRGYRRVPKTAALEKGCCMHILTDIEFRAKMRGFYDSNGVPVEKREACDKLLNPVCVNSIFPDRDGYFACVDFAEKAARGQYPYGITDADVKGLFRYARNLFAIEGADADEPPPSVPIPDYAAWCREIAAYLERVCISPACCCGVE